MWNEGIIFIQSLRLLNVKEWLWFFFVLTKFHCSYFSQKNFYICSLSHDFFFFRSGFICKSFKMSQHLFSVFLDLGIIHRKHSQHLLLWLLSTEETNLTRMMEMFLWNQWILHVLAGLYNTLKSERIFISWWREISCSLTLCRPRFHWKLTLEGQITMNQNVRIIQQKASGVWMVDG